ncbi:MAG TPA: efflux RND transporter permease subunit, partial [Polyangiaceae bacterium]
GIEPMEAARLGTAELAPAVIGTTLTTVVVLFPLAFLSDVVGDFFRALAFTLTAAVVISLAVALVLIPLVPLRKAKLAPREQGREPSVLTSRLSRRLLRRPALTVGFFVLIALSGVAIFPRVQRGFLPTMDEGAFVLDYFLPAGTSLEATETFARGLEGELRKTPEVLTFSRRLGAELGPAAATELNTGDIMVRLRAKRSRSSDEVISELRSKIAAEFPEVRIEFVQVLQDVLNDLAGNPRPVEVKLLGPDFVRLNAFGEKLAERLEHVPGVVDVYAGHEHEVPELRFRARRDALARFGSTAEELSRQLETALRGVTVGSVRRFDRLVNVRVRYPNPVRFNPLALLKTPFSVAGKTSTLEAMAVPELAAGEPELAHEGLSPMVAVTADLEGRDLGSVAADVGRAANELRLPTGYRAVVAGQLEGQRATLRNLSLVAAFATLLVFTVLSVQFRRVRLALLVLLSVPLAIVGALFGLFLTATALNASSLMGIVLLVGLVVKNGVLLLEEAEKRFDRGETPSDAIAGATERRLRPVIMTTAATLVGLLPLALGIGSGVELQRPLAIAVIFGLLSSTVATLGLLPSLALVALETSAKPAPRAN